jgi:hypothetical protein
MVNVAATESWDKTVFMRLGERYNLNGRQIKNLIRTALAISKWEHKELSEEIIETVYKLKQTHMQANLIDERRERRTTDTLSVKLNITRDVTDKVIFGFLVYRECSVWAAFKARLRLAGKMELKFLVRNRATA